jgi:protein-S-isoprenylcysteine O-methyltransferase Ste14
MVMVIFSCAMITFFIYITSGFSLLLFSKVTFRVLFRRDFRARGELSLLSTTTGSLVFFLWGGFPYIYGPNDWPAVHVPELIGITGRLLLFIGLWVMIGSMLVLGLFRSFGRQQTELVRSGPYHLSRNPQVVGVVMYGVGFGSLWPSLYALGWVTLLLPMVHMMVSVEEEHLARVFGEAYREYCIQVPRYVSRFI